MLGLNDGEAGPAATRAGPALQSLVGPDVDAFARDHWGQAPVLRRASERADAIELMTLGEIDELLSEQAIRTPFVRVVDEGATVPASAYTSGTGAGASVNDQVSDTAIATLLADGRTVVLQGLHRSHPRVRRFTSELSVVLGCPVQANAYITPPGRKGFAFHYDVHDVFVVQLSGTKRWRVHEPVHADPLAGQPWTDHRPAVEQQSGRTPLIDTTLCPGDVLYLPRGMVHGAESELDTSVHLTLGVHPPTAHDVARAALALLEDEPSIRKSLPLGALLDEDAHAEVVRKVIAQVLGAIGDLDAGTVARAAASEIVVATRPDPVAPLEQAELLRTLDARTSVVRRPGLLFVADDDSVLLPEKRLVLKRGEAPAVRRVLDGQPHHAGELPGLGSEEAVDLVSRLLRAGALVAAR